MLNPNATLEQFKNQDLVIAELRKTNITLMHQNAQLTQENETYKRLIGPNQTNNAHGITPGQKTKDQRTMPTNNDLKDSRIPADQELPAPGANTGEGVNAAGLPPATQAPLGQCAPALPIVVPEPPKSLPEVLDQIRTATSALKESVEHPLDIKVTIEGYNDYPGKYTLEFTL